LLREGLKGKMLLNHPNSSDNLGMRST